MIFVDDAGEEVDVVTEPGDVGSGVVGWGPHGGWCWFEVVAFEGERAVVRERRDWGDPEAPRSARSV